MKSKQTTLERKQQRLAKQQRRAIYAPELSLAIAVAAYRAVADELQKHLQNIHPNKETPAEDVSK